MNIFVGRLSYETQEKSLRQLFEQMGEVRSVKIITDRETGKSKGFAFVTMSNQAEGQKAVQNLNGASLDGRNISVTEAEDRRGGDAKPSGSRPEFKPRTAESRDTDKDEDRSSSSSNWSESATKDVGSRKSLSKKTKEAPRKGDFDGLKPKKIVKKPKNQRWDVDDDDDFVDYKF